MSKRKSIDDDGGASSPAIATLRIVGPDGKGIVAAFGQLLYGHGSNIIGETSALNGTSSVSFMDALSGLDNPRVFFFSGHFSHNRAIQIIP